MTMFLNEVMPGQVADALTLLLNGRQEIRITQTPAQQQMESALARSVPAVAVEQIMNRLNELASLIRPSLVDALTPSQRESYERGEPVLFEATSTPEPIRALVEDYMRLRLSLLRSFPTHPDIDDSRIDAFQLVLVRTDNMIPVRFVDKEGNAVQF